MALIVEPLCVCHDISLAYRCAPVLHVHSVHEIFLLVRGSGEQVVSGGTVPMRAGELFLFPAGHAHIGNGATGGECYAMVLYVDERMYSPDDETERELRQVLRHLAQTTPTREYRIPLSRAGRQSVARLFAEMIRENQRKGPGCQSAVRVCQDRILLDVLRDRETSLELQQELRKGGGAARFQEVLQYVQVNYMSRITVPAMARRTHLSRSQFHQSFKLHTGRTLTEYVNRVRTRAALELLRETQMPVIEVAYNCGFPCLSHFYEIFRRHTGISPAAARRKTEALSPQKR